MNKFILQCLHGCKINFQSIPIQTSLPHQIKFNKTETEALNEKINDLLKEQMIEICSFEQGDFMNSVFLREKRDSSPDNPKFRMILNMKTLNKQFVELIHHKMHSLSTCTDLMEPGCYMASVDLKDAFHTIPMDPFYTKYLKFKVGDTIYKYLVLPMGFRDSPRLFCKILKPVLAHLHTKGFISSIYIDDFYLQGSSYLDCQDNVKNTLDLLQSLGFEISNKSSLIPSTSIQHLGFILDSCDMSISLASDKREHISKLISKVLSQQYITIQALASITGTLVASFPGVSYGPLFYRNLEFLKIESLKLNNSYKHIICLNEDCNKELNWWLAEGLTIGNVISHGNPDFIIQSDSSGYGWGALLIGSNKKTQGLWGEEESCKHINVLELKAAFLGVKALCSELYNCHIQIQIDNQTAVTYINNMGGTHSKICNFLTKDFIIWCKDRFIWLSACHIAGIDNIKADTLSREINENIEWMLNPSIFSNICERLGTPHSDLFASRVNKQLSVYFSYHPDDKAAGINAFAHKWNMFVYIFPPFNLITRILRKLKEDRTEKAILIVPRWTVAPWYPMIMTMLIRPPYLIPVSQNTLIMPNNRQKVHPLFPLRLMACLLSGKNSKGKV